MDTKKLIRFAICMLIAVLLKQTVHAQNSNSIDKIPMDIAYFRINNIEAPLAKVVYGRPVKTGEQVFGTQVPYDKLWCAGANEATEIKFYQDVSFNGISISAGTYVVYAIPHENQWEIILSANLDVWEVNQYDPVFDRARITVPVAKTEQTAYFSIAFKEQPNGFNMVMRWDTTKINIPVGLINTDNYTAMNN